MLPPVATTLLEANPHFAKLYKHLTCELLEANGSSKSSKSVHDATVVEIQKHREATQTDNILILLLKDVAVLENVGLSKQQQRPIGKNGKKKGVSTIQQSRMSETTMNLAPDLRALVYVLHNYLLESLIRWPPSLPDDADELMSEEVETFKSRIQEVSAVLSSHVVNSEKLLAQLASVPDQSQQHQQQPLSLTSKTSKHPPTSSSTSRLPQRSTPSTVPSDASLASVLTSQRSRQSLLSQSTLPQLLSDTSSTLLTLLSTHEALINSHIRHLEQTTHGTQSRHLLSHAAFLRTVAEGMALKTTIQHLTRQKDIYGDDDMVRALSNVHEHLSAEERVLQEREQKLEALMAEYEACDGGEQRMRVLGERHAEVEEESARVKQDVERLREQLADGGKQRRPAGKGR